MAACSGWHEGVYAYQPLTKERFVKFGRFMVAIHCVMASPVREYPVSAEEYELLEEAGRGVSATVRPFSM